MKHAECPFTDPQKAARKLFDVVGLVQALEQRYKSGVLSFIGTS